MAKCIEVAADLVLVPAFYLSFEDVADDPADGIHATLFDRAEVMGQLPPGDDGAHAFFCDALALVLAAAFLCRHCFLFFSFILCRQTVK